MEERKKGEERGKYERFRLTSTNWSFVRRNNVTVCQFRWMLYAYDFCRFICVFLYVAKKNFNHRK